MISSSGLGHYLIRRNSVPIRIRTQLSLFLNNLKQGCSAPLHHIQCRSSEKRAWHHNFWDCAPDPQIFLSTPLISHHFHSTPQSPLVGNGRPLLGRHKSIPRQQKIGPLSKHSLPKMKEFHLRPWPYGQWGSWGEARQPLTSYHVWESKLVFYCCC